MERRAIEVCGIVQGVGFRPFIFNLAAQFHLTGFVRNQSGHVRIEIEGSADSLDQFVETLTRRPPPLARIEHIVCRTLTCRDDATFEIQASDADDDGQIFISPDIAMCDACRAELWNPADRRYRYPFLNCTHCGPRLTIIRGSPYDRQNTTMADFAMCPDCRREYEDPANRRFHAQPTACPVCGPKLELRDTSGLLLKSPDPLIDTAGMLREGAIAAIKGLGGFHLACIANDEAAVARLRQRKNREGKPFALMVRDGQAAAALVMMSDAERQLLTGPRRPIVLLRRRPGCAVAPSVAPGNPYLGVMLPYAPLHELLLHELGENVSGLVMTSGNRSDEPIAYDNDDAMERLSGIADVFLLHNRPIHVRCDDSVSRVIGGMESPVRRSRGYAPQPIALPQTCTEPMLATGGQLKATFALGRDRWAFVSHHLGDLDHVEAHLAFEKDETLYEELFAIRPKVIVHDLHPGYATTQYAKRRATMDGSRLIAVQHHHAHMASCMAEHGLTGPVIGVSFDGTGYGTDGAIWGGEFFIGDYRHVRRAAHLEYAPMPGGDKAIREPWRMATAHLLAAGCSTDRLKARLPVDAVEVVEQMCRNGFNSPQTSSMGRLFDAVASMIGVRDRVSYEGQAAMGLEQLAYGQQPMDGYPLMESDGKPLVLTVMPMIRAIMDDLDHDVEAAVIARRFHATIAAMIVTICRRLREQTGLTRVVLSGGVFMNALLSQETNDALASEGFEIFRHRLVPPNDGGLSLGQLAIGAAMLAEPDGGDAVQ